MQFLRSRIFAVYLKTATVQERNFEHVQRCALAFKLALVSFWNTIWAVAEAVFVGSSRTEAERYYASNLSTV